MTLPWEDYTPPSDVAARVAAEAQRQNVDPNLALRVATQESGLRQGAVSPKGAVGVMQLEPGTAQGLGVDPHDLSDNIRGGVTYLKQQLDTFGDPRLAAAAYNAGPGAVRRHGGVPPYPETQQYVDIVAPASAPQSADESPPWADFAAPPQASPPAASPTPTTSQGLGFLKGAFAPVDHAANWLESGLRGNMDVSGLAKAGAALRHILPQQAVSFIDNPGAFYDAQAAKGVVPGKVGEFAGNVAGTAMMPGGPLVNGAATGALLSDKSDPMGVAGDAVVGALGGKVGAGAVAGVGHLISGVTDPAVRLLASKGVPMTLGQLAGGVTHNIEDKLTSVPVIGDMIRNAQRQGIAGAQRAAWNDTLAPIGDALPATAQLGHDAYNYTKKALGDAYDAVLQPLTVQRDPTFSAAIKAAKGEIAKIGDPTIANTALAAIKASVEKRIAKGGQMTGDALKDAQSDLSSHINDLRTVVGSGGTWSRKAADALAGVKGAIEDLVARTDPQAGQQLAQVNKAYSLFKPLEAASKAAAVKDGGEFTLNQFAQGVAKGKGASTLASGNAPHQALATAASQVLPSTVPDSGTAGRSAMTMLLGGLLAGHGLPHVGGASLPLAGLIGGGAAAYSKMGQKLLTSAATVRNDTARQIGHYVDLLSAPAGTGTAALLTGH